MLRFLATRSSFRNPRRLAVAGSLLSLGGAAAALASSGDSSTATTISVSPPLLHFISRASNLLPPLFSISPGLPLPLSNLSKKIPPDATGGVKDDSPCCPGCLGKNSIANAAAAVGAAVVNVSVTQAINGLMLGKSIGSGTIIDPDGTILTCAHVVVDFQSSRAMPRGKVDVTLQDGRQFEGTVVNADMHSDIAIVKIKSRTPLPHGKLGLSGKLRPGDWVVALGCPLTLQNTITAGILC